MAAAYSMDLRTRVLRGFGRGSVVERSSPSGITLVAPGSMR